MPGGRFHAPIWTPYELYARVDYVYGWPAWEAGDGFTAAQSLMNLVETLGYVVYLVLVLGGEGRGNDGVKRVEGVRGIVERRVEGGRGALAVLLGFALGVMTLSKTFLYCKSSGLRGTGRR